MCASVGGQVQDEANTYQMNLDALKTIVRKRATSFELLSFWYPINNCPLLPRVSRREGLEARKALKEVITFLI